MRKTAGALLALTLMACSGSSSDDSGGAEVPEYEVIVEEVQSPQRRWVELEVAEHADGAAEAVAADYIDKADPDQAETVVKVSFPDEPWLDCTIFWPDDDRNDGCPTP